MSAILDLIKAGGFIMFPLGFFSILVWGVIFDRVIQWRTIGNEMSTFHLEAINRLLQGDWSGVHALCRKHPQIPNSRVVEAALRRIEAKDAKLKTLWHEALERERQRANQDLRRWLWVLGTIASSAPFVGLFGTVVGILRTFQDMARSGAGGFGVVAAGISEALIATAAGILVAVVASLAFNIFQTRWTALVMVLRHQTEEVSEIISKALEEKNLEGRA